MYDPNFIQTQKTTSCEVSHSVIELPEVAPIFQGLLSSFGTPQWLINDTFHPSSSKTWRIQGLLSFSFPQKRNFTKEKSSVSCL